MYIKWYIWLVLFSQMKLEKRRITSIDSEIIQEVYLTVKKNYRRNSDHRSYFLVACSLFFFQYNVINYDLAIKHRP